MRVELHVSVGVKLWLWIAVCLGTGFASAARAASPRPPGPPALPPPELCADGASCDYATGAGCRVTPPETLTIFPFDAETVAGLEGFASSCQAPWDGSGGCYEARIQKGVDQLVETSRAIADAADRARSLPPAAREVCQRLEPARAQSAVDEAPAWCVTGRRECIAGLKDARRVLDEMHDWVACIERMEAYASENERGEVARAECEARQRALTPVLELPKRVAKAPREEPRVESPKRLETPKRVEAPKRVVVMGPGRVSDRLPRDELAAPDARDIKPTNAPDTSTVSGTRTHPDVDAGHRKGQLDLSVAPFSGTLTIRDPATSGEHNPLMASIGAGIDVVLALSPDLAVELGFAGRGAFASTALGQGIGTDLADLELDTGTAFVVELEPTVSLLSEYVGIGVVGVIRWDSLAVTSAATGLVQSHDSGAAGGVRLIAGLGLLERDLRLVASLDLLFVGSDELATRFTLSAELDALILTGAYHQHFRLGEATAAYIVDDLQLTLGYRGAF